jgi:hypothetical protein
MIFICNFHVLSHLLLIYICKLHWNQAALSSASVVGICDDIVLDPTSSVGHAGRSWKSVQWTIQKRNEPNNNQTHVDFLYAKATVGIEPYLNLNCKTTKVVCTLPNSFLLDGYTYVFRLALTNFFGESSITSVSVEVLSEIKDNYQRVMQTGVISKLVIAAPPVITMFRNESLNVFASVSFTECG